MNATLQQQLGYREDTILVIAHIDDLGMHKDETDGSMDVLSFGMARTASAMVPAPDFLRFAEVWKDDPSLDIGIHITLNSEWDEFRWSGSLGSQVAASLHDEEGYLWKNQELYRKFAEPDEVQREIEAQVTTALEAGLAPTHMDPHMYTAFHRKDSVEAMLQVAERYNLALPFAPPGRLEEFRRRGFATADTFNGFYHIPGEVEEPDLRRRAYTEWLENVGPGVHYLFLHPARVSPDLTAKIRSPHIRQGDYEVWRSQEIRELANSRDIRFIGCRELQELQRSMK